MDIYLNNDGYKKHVLGDLESLIWEYRERARQLVKVSVANKRYADTFIRWSCDLRAQQIALAKEWGFR